jgi:hypothetical protein
MTAFCRMASHTPSSGCVGLASTVNRRTIPSAECLMSRTLANGLKRSCAPSR